MLSCYLLEPARVEQSGQDHPRVSMRLRKKASEHRTKIGHSCLVGSESDRTTWAMVIHLLEQVCPNHHLLGAKSPLSWQAARHESTFGASDVTMLGK